MAVIVKDNDKEERALNLITQEYAKASNKFGPFASAHEGFAILLEEVDELWDEVKKQQTMRSKTFMLTEAKQIAAMAMRFMVDLCLEDEDDEHSRSH